MIGSAIVDKQLDICCKCMRIEIFEHYSSGKSISGLCPDELSIFEKLDDDLCRCVICGEELSKDECVTIDDGDTWFCQSCYDETF